VAIESLLQNRKIKAGLIAIASILVICLSSATWIDKFQRAEKNVHQYWEMLTKNCDQRVEMLPQFAQLVQYYAPQAKDLIQTLNASYQFAKQYHASEQLLNSPAGINGYSKLQNQIVGALFQMEQQISTFPNLAQSKQYFMLYKQLNDVELQIFFANKSLNRQIESYNRLITIWPEAWFNAIYPRAKSLYPASVLTLESFEKSRN